MLLESDSLVVDNAIKHCKVYDACFGLIIADYISLLKQIPNYSISFGRRSVNQVAHVLVRAYVSMSSFGVWHLDPPTLIVDVLKFHNE